MREIRINQRVIGPGHPVYIVAEMSANHRQDRSVAIELVRQAALAGADAVKVQLYTPDCMTISHHSDDFLVKDGLWGGTALYDLYAKAMMPWSWYPRLRAEAHSFGMDFFSSVFSKFGLDYLERYDCPAYKIASFECGYIDLITAAGRTGKPVIISTGGATDDEIVASVSAAGEQVAILKCSAAYPAPDDQVNLSTIPVWSRHLGIPVGYSDNSAGRLAPVAAAALGACIIEKHLRLEYGPSLDEEFSIGPSDFKGMVKQIRDVERLRGTVSNGPTKAEVEHRQFRRSLYVVKDIAEGERFTKGNIGVIRPGYGAPPRALPGILGKKSRVDLSRGTPFSERFVGGYD